MNKDCIVVDLETNSLDTTTANIRVFGAYDPEQNKYFIYKWGELTHDRVIELLKGYNTIFTFNGINYDMPILERHGIRVTQNHVDIYDIFKNKRPYMIKTGGFESYSMHALIMQLGLDTIGKRHIDYEVFKKEHWTPTEQDEIIHYLKQDLALTWKLWKYLDTRFKPLSKYISKKDVEQYKHILTTPEIYAYKVICHGAKVQEVYDEQRRSKFIPVQYGTNPKRQYYNESIILLRFTNLALHNIIQYNLASFDCPCCETREGKYHGRNIYTVKGYYCQRTHGRIEKFLKELYTKALTDPEAKIVSTIVNKNLYSIITNPIYYAIYEPHGMGAYDCWNLSRQQLKYTKEKFEEKGYDVIYIDTDDIFIHLTDGQGITDLLKVKDKIITTLKERMPFPSETFNLQPRERIQYAQFFSKGASPFMYKRTYVYITDDGRVVAKGVTEEDIQTIVARVKHK